MKIAILTLPLHSNYGGILQAYALQTTLERMGHEVTVITQDRRIRYSFFIRIKAFGSYFIKKYVLLRKNVLYSSQKKQNRELAEREQYTRAFIDKYIHTHIVKQLSTDVPDKFDAYVVGSDQIWRNKYVASLYHTGIENAFLKFAEGQSVKRVAYAPSFGTDEWEYSIEETKECERLLSLFDAVSVREESAITLCEKYLCRSDSQLVLDPTLLLNKEDYIRLVDNSNTPKSPGNLMCYVLDDLEEKKSFINQIAKERGLQPFYANSRIEDRNAPQKDRIQPPLENWLRGFMDAEFVITDSYHACIFSIIFGKPFVVICNKERGIARFKSLLSVFSLEKNCIFSVDDYNSQYSYVINPEVYNILEEKRKQSLLFLNGNLQ